MKAQIGKHSSQSKPNFPCGIANVSGWEMHWQTVDPRIMQPKGCIAGPSRFAPQIAYCRPMKEIPRGFHRQCLRRRPRRKFFARLYCMYCTTGMSRTTVREGKWSPGRRGPPVSQGVWAHNSSLARAAVRADCLYVPTFAQYGSARARRNMVPA